MQDEVINLWLPTQHASTSKSTHLVDGTIGLGGHTLAALNSEHGDTVHVLGVDRDESTLAKAMKRIKLENDMDTSSRIQFHHGSFSDISQDLLRQYYASPKVDGILMDLGMNSHQIENGSRGFTFRKDGPLDMRFNTLGGGKGSDSFDNIKARDIINNWSASEIASVFEGYSDEPYAKEIADYIVYWRQFNPNANERRRERVGIRSTLELRYVIEEAIECMNGADKSGPFRKFKAIWKRPKVYSKPKMDKLLKKYEQRKLRHAPHVMRCFQALRIQVNNELDHIQSIFQLKIASECLNVGGRLAIIAFHPGEDELVRMGMNRMTETGEFKLLTPEDEGLRPSYDEVKTNKRSRTARLRVVERVG